MKSSNLLNKLLEIRNQMKLYHWQTNSYARHKAADKFLEKTEIIIDKIIESYQGKYNTIRVNKNTNKIKIDNINNKDIENFLIKFKNFLMDDYSKFINLNKNTNLINLRDELIENINITLYLFKLK